MGQRKECIEPAIPAASLLAGWVRTPQRQVATILVLAAAYALAGRWGLTFWTVQQNVTLVWPPTGIALAAVLLLGYRTLPGVALGAFVGSLAAGGSVGFALVTAVGNPLEAFLGAWLLRRLVGFRSELDRVRDAVGLLVLAAGVSTLSGALIGSTALCLADGVRWSQFSAVWTSWWLGDALGIVIVAPVLLSWLGRGFEPWWRQRALEAGGYLLLVAAVSRLAFDVLVYPHEYSVVFAWIPLPLLLIAAFRYGPRGATMAALVVSAVAVLGLSHEGGPFAGHTPTGRLVLLVTFMGGFAVTALLLSVLLVERDRAAAELRAAYGDLEQRVGDRTAALTAANARLRAEIAERLRADESLRASEERLRLAAQATREYMWDWDVARDTCVWNERFGDDYGPLEAGQPAFDWWRQRVHPDDLAEVAARVEAALRDGATHWVNEYRIRRADGRYASVIDRAYVVRDADGRPVRAVGAMLDVTDHKQAQAELRRLTDTLENILRSATEYAIAAIDCDFRVIHFNPAAERLFGCAAASVVGRTLTAIHAERGMGPEKLERAVQQALDQGKWEATLVLPRQEGQAHVHAVAMPMRGADGGVTGFTLFARDVTAQKRADELAELQRRLALELGGIGDLAVALRLCVTTAHQITGFDLAGVYLVDDQGALDLACQVGLSPEAAECVQHFDAETARAQAVRTGRALYGRHPEPARELGFAPVLPDLRAVAYVPIARAGRVIACLAVASQRCDDIPADTRAALEAIAAQAGTAIARLRVDAERLRLFTAVEQAAEGILITDAEGRITYVNPAFECITGHEREEVLGRNPRLLKSGRHNEQFYREMWETVARGATWSGHITNRRKDGQLYQQHTTISPVHDSQGRTVNYVAVLRDVTHEVAVEAHLQQTQKMRAVGRLAGGVAHQLNNLLTAISGRSEAIEASLPADHPVAEHTASIQRAIDRAAELIRQLLAFSRQRVVQPKALELNTVVRNAVSLLRPLVGEQVQIETRLTARGSQVFADAGQLQELLTNLCINAQEAMPRGGTITIETSALELRETRIDGREPLAPGRYVTLAIHDTGQGMDAETQARIFEPFFTTKEVGQGAGLGLAIVYGIVQQCGGRIVVHSTRGRGTTFRVYFPRLAGGPEAAIARPAEQRGSRKHSVLVAEDETEVRDIVRDILLAEGYDVVTAANGDEALEAAEQSGAGFDLLVTDMVMPGMSGRELADQLRQLGAVERVLFISGYAEDALPGRATLGRGAVFLAKPFTRRALTARVREMLRAAPGTTAVAPSPTSARAGRQGP